MGFKNCIKPLIEFSDALCRKYGTSFSFGFTTNAVLLSEETCDILARFDREVSMQIPFDGDRPMHDSIKRTATGKGTYDRILTNLKYALSKGFYITVRCNYTTKSAASFRNLVEDIKPLLVTYPSRVRVSFQQVWQDLNQHKANPIIDELESEISNIGAHCYCSDADISRCYADKKILSSSITTEVSINARPGSSPTAIKKEYFERTGRLNITNGIIDEWKAGSPIRNVWNAIYIRYVISVPKSVWSRETPNVPAQDFLILNKICC